MSGPGSRPKRWQALFPWLVAALSAVYLFVPPKGLTHDSAMRIDRFARLPVSYKGRVKPVDSVARSALLILSNRQSFEHEGARVEATPWLLDVITRPKKAEQYEVFRIDHPQVKAIFGLQQSKRKRFALREIHTHQSELIKKARAAGHTPASMRDAYQRKLIDLAQHLMRYNGLAFFEDLHLMPPEAPGADWGRIDTAHEKWSRTGTAPPGFLQWRDMLIAYQEQNSEKFNSAVAGYGSQVGLWQPTAAKKAVLEEFFNRYAPFYRGLTLYVVVTLLVFVSWLGWGRPLRRAALFALILTVVLHTLALAARVYLSGRPPVTNLYSSAVFIGWGFVLMCLVLEWLYRNSIPTLLGASAGFLTLIIAHHLGRAGDTMAVLVAVLDTNFWLATHVVVVTLGYAATYLAGFIGIVYIFRGLLTRTLSKTESRRMGQMLYGVVCFALLFSFVGTILGGIWADQSWGRFWGWDPKENGAVLIVLWNALILHARWGGMAHERGMAALAVFGNIVTSWSWFGTNMLGVGLHAYGFIDSAVFWLLFFVVSQLAIMLAACLPLRFWRSFRQGVPRAATQAKGIAAGAVRA